MKIASVFVLSLHMIASITAVTVTNGTSYDPAELLSKIFNSNSTIESRQRGYGLIRFEDQPDSGIDPDQDPGQYGVFDLGQRPLRFEDNDQNYNTNDYNPQSDGSIKFQDSEDDLSSNQGGVAFQDDNRVEDQGNKKKRKRRRRRKPKNGVLPYPGTGGLPPGRPGADGRPERRPGFQEPYQAGYGQNPYGNPGYPIQPYRRPRRRRPKPSLATEALSSITGALTSIAQYDDYQCVPRLLCEAAGGGALSDNGVLQSIAGIQPLLALLSAYNGISTSPLFVFGRAVFLGMTSKGNTGTCRYAYPQCPTDPEQLIYYLNNHNGGFFRFFNAPQLPNQNLEQFYDQLGNQGYGVYQPQQNLAQQSYGYPNDPNSAQNYGLYPNDQNYQYPNPGVYDNQYNGQNYESQRPGANDRPSLYKNQNYSPNYANDYNYGSGNQIRFKDSNAKIEKRIQNKPTQNLADDSFEEDDVKTKWQFPDDLLTHADLNINNNNVRDSRTLKFPEEGQSFNDQKDSIRKGKQVNFPDNNNNQNHYNNYQQFTDDNRYQTTTYSYNNGHNNQNHYTNRPNTYTNNNNRYQTTTYSYNNGYNNQNYNTDRPNTYTNNNNRYQTTTYSYNNGYNNQNYYTDRPNTNTNNNRYQTTTYSYNNGHNNQNYYTDRPNTYTNNNNYKPYNNYDYNSSNNNNKYQNQQNYYNNRQNMYTNNQKYQPTTIFNNEEYVFDHKHNFYVKKENNYSNINYNANNVKRNENGIKTVYVVRGNGDPSRPEIVKLRPGQSVY